MGYKCSPRITQPSGAASPEKADTRHWRASVFSGCSFGGDFTSSSRPCCGRGREGPCFGVWAVVCDLSPRAKCVPAFTCESERGPFVREVEKRDEKRLGTALVTAVLLDFPPLLDDGGSQRTGKCMNIKAWRNQWLQMLTT